MIHKQIYGGPEVALERRISELEAQLAARKAKAQEYCDTINRLLLERDTLAKRLAEATRK